VKRLLLVVVLAAVSLAGILAYASSRREETYRSLIDQGNAALAQGESFAGVEAFTVAIALKPGSMLGYLKRGEAYRQYGELETALKDLRTAARLDPSATRPLELLGDVEHALERYDRAIDRYEQYVRIDDRSPRVLYKLALARYHAGDPMAAVDALRGATAIDEGFAEAHYLMGLCFAALAAPDDARRALQRAVDLSPALLEARQELAALHGRTRDSDARIAQLESLLAADPDSPARHLALAEARAAGGEFDRAAALLTRAVDRFPGDAYMYVALGRTWLQGYQSRPEAVTLQKALEALERGAALDGSSESLQLLGQALLLAGETERAAAVLLDASARTPRDPLAFYYLAEAAERTGNVPVARGALLDYHALRGDPEGPRSRYRLCERIADLSLRMDDHVTAAEWLQRAAAADPALVDAPFLVRLAETRARLGEHTAARDALTRALQLDPAHRGARALQRRLPPV
jgi:tetratricopeptide (TPR) repeat protein